MRWRVSFDWAALSVNIVPVDGEARAVPYEKIVGPFVEKAASRWLGRKFDKASLYAVRAEFLNYAQEWFAHLDVVVDVDEASFDRRCQCP